MDLDAVRNDPICPVCNEPREVITRDFGVTQRTSFGTCPSRHTLQDIARATDAS